MPALQDPLKNGKIWSFAHAGWLRIYWSSSLSWEKEDQKDKGTQPPPRCPMHLHYSVSFSTGHLVNHMAQLCQGEGPLGMSQHTH